VLLDLVRGKYAYPELKCTLFRPDTGISRRT
jgi:hypothetical protein